MLGLNDLVKCISYAAQCGDDELVVTLSSEINLRRAGSPPAKKSPNRSGVAKLDLLTNEILETYPTIKEANIALGKKETASGISDAINRSKTGIAYGYRWVHLDEL